MNAAAADGAGGMTDPEPEGGGPELVAVDAMEVFCAAAAAARRAVGKRSVTRAEYEQSPELFRGDLATILACLAHAARGVGLALDMGIGINLVGSVRLDAVRVLEQSDHLESDGLSSEGDP